MEIRREELKAVVDVIGDGAHSVHIYGEPGVGKTVLVDQIREELEWSSAIVQVRNGDSKTRVIQACLEVLRSEASGLTSLRNRLNGFNLSARTPVGGGGGGMSVDDRARHLAKIEGLTESMSHEFVLCIDDIHKVGDRPEVCDFIAELADALDESITLLSTGRVPETEVDCPLELGTFSLEETRAFLVSEFGEVDDETVENAHSQLDGHPYYLGLLSESTEADASLELPTDDVYNFVEERYLGALSTEEEEFLIQTSVLAELDEEICAAVLSKSRAETRQLLRSLEDKVVVRYVERSDQTNHRVYKVHDLFQQILYRRLEDPEAQHRAAFQYYADSILDEVSEADISRIALEGVMLAVFANQHLKAIYEDPQVDQVQSEIDRLGYDRNQRLKFAFGYGPYAPVSELFGGGLLALEIDDYVEWLTTEQVEQTDPDFQMSLAVLDILRAQQRKIAEYEFDETTGDVSDSALSRIERVDFEEPIVGDFLRLFIEIGFVDDPFDEDELTPVFEILGSYGLSQEVAERFAETCQSFKQQLDLEEEFEQAIEAQLDSVFETSGGNELTRSALVGLQSDFYTELVGWTRSALTAAFTDTDLVIEFIEDAGDELAAAENPLYVAVWYELATEMAHQLVPNSPVAAALEETTERYREDRRVYEEELEDPIVTIDEFEVDDINEALPELATDIANGPALDSE